MLINYYQVSNKPIRKLMLVSENLSGGKIMTIAQYIIGRDAIAESDFNCHDKITFTKGTDIPVAEPHEVIAAIIAEIIEKGEAV